MAAINLRTAAWLVGEPRRVMAVLAAVGAVVVLAIAIVVLKGQLPVHSVVHAFDRIPAPFRHELSQASGGHLVAKVTHHFAHR
jgi:hypothetical protein